MSYYGNNLAALMTGGTLVFIDEPAGGDAEETQFDSHSLAVREIFLEWWSVDGVYQPGTLNRLVKVIPKYVTDDDLTDGTIRHKSPLLTIKVPNTQINGITAEEFEPHQLISLCPRKGAAARTFRLLRIAKQSASWVTFDVK